MALVTCHSSLVTRHASLVRFLLGAMNGVDGATKTMISEVCGQEHEISGMSFLTGELSKANADNGWLMEPTS